MSPAHKRLQGHQAITHHQPAGPQEKDDPKNVDHAGREHAIPGPEQHWLPYEQLDLPPGLGLGQHPLEQSTESAQHQGGPGRGRAGREVDQEEVGELSYKILPSYAHRAGWHAHRQNLEG